MIVVLALLNGHARNILIERSWVHPETNCWEWQRYGDGRYGHVWFGGVRFKAHVLSAAVFAGKVTKKGQDLHHTCDNPKCINPDHLKVVRHSTNIRFWHRGRK